MIEHVEGLRSELQASSFCESKVLEERQVEVVTAWPSDGIESEIAVAIGTRAARRAGRGCKRRCAEPLAGSFGIGDMADQVRPFAAIGNKASRRRSVRPAGGKRGQIVNPEIDRSSAFLSDDGRELPATKRRLEQAAAIPQEGNIVDKAGEEYVPAVIDRRSPVIPPSRIGIGDVLQVGATAGGRGGIVRLRHRVAGLQVEIMSYMPIQRGL